MQTLGAQHRARAGASAAGAAARTHAPVGFFSLLDIDPQLDGGLSREGAQIARERTVVRVEGFAKGRWQPRLAAGAAAGMAMLVVEGLLLHEPAPGRGAGTFAGNPAGAYPATASGARAGAARGRLAEQAPAGLFGGGDVVAPWDGAGSAAGEWRALSAGRVALLDERLLAQIVRWPGVAAALACRSARRARLLSGFAHARRLRRVEDRLAFALAALGERWGQAEADGTHLRLAISHEALGLLIGARRQSVSSALARLHQRRTIAALDHGGWLIERRGEPLRAHAPPAAWQPDAAHRPPARSALPAAAPAGARTGDGGRVPARA